MTREEYLAKIAIATAAAEAYYNTDVQHITDEQYDRLVESIEEAGLQNGWTEHTPLTEEVAAGTSTSSNGNAPRENRMLSLSKITTTEELEAFLNKFSDSLKFVCEPKLDGFAISAKYVNGILTSVTSRGDGDSGDDLLENIKQYVSIKNLPASIDFQGALEVRGEVYLTSEGLTAANVVRESKGQAPYNLERSAAAGAVRSKKDVRYVDLNFTAYDVFLDEPFETYTETMNWARQYGFQTPADVVQLSNSTDPRVVIQKFGETLSSLKVPVDGMVLKLDNYAARIEAGEGSRHPYWAAAFKYPSATAQTVFRGVNRTIGKTGAVSYRLQVDPVRINGSILSQATGNNAKFIDDLDLHIGDTIIIRKAGEIIPEVLSVVLPLRPEGAEKWVAPRTCPICDEPLDTNSSTVWRCLDPECAVLERLIHATSKQCLDIEGLSRKRIELLVDEGMITTPADIFSLTLNDIATLETGEINKDGEPILVGQVVGKTIHDSIKNAKENAPLAKVLASLGIRNLGKTLSKHLADTYRNIDVIMSLTLNEWVNMAPRGRRLGESIATRVYHSLQSNRTTVAKMKDLGVVSLNTTQEAVAGPAAGGVLENQNVCVSGSVPGHNRDSIKELIESKGGKAVGSVSRTTTILVTDPESTSSKAVNARKYGTRIISPEDFLNLLS